MPMDSSNHESIQIFWWYGNIGMNWVVEVELFILDILSSLILFEIAKSTTLCIELWNRIVASTVFLFLIIHDWNLCGHVSLILMPFLIYIFPSFLLPSVTTAILFT